MRVDAYVITMSVFFLYNDLPGQKVLAFSRAPLVVVPVAVIIAGVVRPIAPNMSLLANRCSSDPRSVVSYYSVSLRTCKVYTFRCYP